MATEVIVVVDRVEEKTFEGKPSGYKLIDKGGEERTIGKVLNTRISELQSGMAVKLTMDTFNGNPYVKDFARCIDMLPDKIKELSKPIKNIKDISIEAQAAVKCATDLMAQGVECPDDIKELTFEWIRRSLKEAVE